MYSPACDLCNLSRNSAEKPFWTEGTVPRHCWETNKTARRFGRGATNLSTKACKLGTRSDAESNRRGSTPSDENASALSCTAFRSFSNSTITIAMASSICGIGPRKPPNWPTIVEEWLTDLPRAHQRRPQRQRQTPAFGRPRNSCEKRNGKNETSNRAAWRRARFPCRKYFGGGVAASR